MSKTTYPKVFLIGETQANADGIAALMAHYGVPEWRSDAESSAELVTEIYGRCCYRSFGTDLNPNITRVRSTNRAYLTNTLEKGDGSIFEHAVANFFFADVSRVFTHELVRHRVGTAMSQESLRFARLTDLDWYAPTAIRESTEGMEIFARTMDELGRLQVELAELFEIDDGDKSFDEKKKLTSAFRRVAPIGLRHQHRLVGEYAHAPACDRTAHGAVGRGGDQARLRAGRRDRHSPLAQHLRRLRDGDGRRPALVYHQEPQGLRRLNKMADEFKKGSITYWLAHGERGLSSEAMAFTTLGETPRADHPHDPADLRRCLLLLDAVPETWQGGVMVLAKRSPHWAALARIWLSLVETLRLEVGPDFLAATGHAPLSYRLMRAALECADSGAHEYVPAAPMPPPRDRYAAICRRCHHIRATFQTADLARIVRERADEIARALFVESCHRTTGAHDKTHTPRYYCRHQRADLAQRLVDAAGVSFNALPRRAYTGSATPEVERWIRDGVPPSRCGVCGERPRHCECDEANLPS